MKKWQVIVLSVCALALVAPMSSYAGKGKKKGAAQAKTVPSDVYAMYDKNTNGVLDADEKAALLADFAKDPTGTLKIYDLNSDGKLSDDEVTAIPATKQVEAPKKKKKG
jgi:Ca2+-binding EF-hand superfamily protein